MSFYRFLVRARNDKGDLAKKKKITPKKRKIDADALKAFAWFLKDSSQLKIRIPPRITQHLKVLGFLSVWFTIPFLLLLVLLSPAPRAPEFFPVQPAPGAPSGGIDIYFKVKLRGVQKKNVANQPLFVKAVNYGNELCSFSFNPLSVWQDENDPSLFRGKLTLSEGQLCPGFTFYLKGPVHLQRRFDNIALVEGEELDLTSKPLLPGDLILPEEGQNDQVDNLDRDYLKSLIAKDGKRPTAQEIRAGDLDLDGDIDGRDYSLLIDTGIGTEGER